MVGDLPLVMMARGALLERVGKLRDSLSAERFRTMTGGHTPEDLSDDGLRLLIAQIERSLPSR